MPVEIVIIAPSRRTVERSKKKQNTLKLILNQLRRQNETLTRLHTEVRAMRDALRFASTFLDPFIYSEGKATVKRDPNFRKRVIAFYNASRLFRLRFKKQPSRIVTRVICAATGVPLPEPLIVAAHLFKFAWRSQKDVLSLPSINDEKNGLPLIKGVESAIDYSQFCYIKKDGQFQGYLLDQSLRDVGILEYTKEKLKGTFEEPEEQEALERTKFKNVMDIHSVTFGDLHGEPLHIPATTSPYSRCLCFSAHQARKRAIRLGWVKEGEFEFQDFWSEGMSNQEKVTAWLHQSGIYGKQKGTKRKQSER